MKNTTCPKIGIKIFESNNDYKSNPFEGLNKNNKSLLTSNNFDLNIDNYNMKDIFHLFNIKQKY